MATLRLTSSVSASNPNLNDLYLDDSGQLEIIGTDITDTSDYALAVAQTIKCRLLFIKGEWYQDQRLGTPWRERIWKKGTTRSTMYRLLNQVIKATPGVRSVESMDIDIDAASRTVTVTDLKVTTETGQVVTIDQLDEPMIITAPEDTL